MKVLPYGKTFFRLKLSLETGNNFEIVNLFPGSKSWFGEMNRDLKVRNDRTTISWIIENWPDAEWLEGTDKLMEEHLDRCTKEAAQAALKSQDIVKSSFQFEREPMAHQEKGFELAKDESAFGWLFDPGTGKTLVALANASYLFQQDEIDMMIVIAWPSDVHYNWVENEVPEDVACPYDAYAWERGPKGKTQKQKTIRDRLIKAEPGQQLKIVTFNVEAFRSAPAKEFMADCLDHHRCMVVIDESASIKNSDSGRTKYILENVARHKNCLYRRILDGDAMAEGPQELFSQFFFLDPEIFRCKNFKQFKNLYVLYGPVPGTKFQKIIGFKNEAQLRKNMEPYCMRARKSECLNLPPIDYKRKMFEMTKEEQRVYDELAQQGLAFFTEDAKEELAGMKDVNPEEINDDDILMEHLAMVKNMRLQQISAGWFPKKDSHRQLEDGKVPSRAQALLDWAKEFDGQALIFTRFVSDMNLLSELLGNDAFVFRGNAIEEIKAKFQGGERRFMIGNSAKMSIGHTLTSAHHVIFYTNHPSLRYRTQGEARAHRKGQEHPVTAWDFICRETTDSKLVNALRNKRKISDIIMEDPSGFFLNYTNE